MTHDELIQSCQRFLEVWHENGRARFTANYQNLDYDGPSYVKSMKERRDWICLDRGDRDHASGVFMVRKSDEHVFVVKGYGVPNLRKDCGHICDLITRFSLATVDGKELVYSSSLGLPVA